MGLAWCRGALLVLRFDSRAFMLGVDLGCLESAHSRCVSKGNCLALVGLSYPVGTN